MNIIYMYNSSEHVNEVSSYYSVLYTNQFVYTFKKNKQILNC